MRVIEVVPEYTNREPGSSEFYVVRWHLRLDTSRDTVIGKQKPLCDTEYVKADCRIEYVAPQGATVCTRCLNILLRAISINAE